MAVDHIIISSSSPFSKKKTFFFGPDYNNE